MSDGSILQEPGRKPSAIVDAVIDASAETAGEVLVVTAALAAAFQSTGVILTSPTIQGTVSEGTGLTMPAFTGGGDITLGANKLKTTTALIKEESSQLLTLKILADTDYADLKFRTLFPTLAIQAVSANIDFATQSVDNATMRLLARDSGVGLVEVARLQGAAEPRFKFILPAQNYRDAGDYGGGFSTYTPPTGVEGDIVIAEDTNAVTPGRRIYVYSGGAWRYVNLS